MERAKRTQLGMIADRIEAELSRLGRWATAPIDPARLADIGPFGSKTLAPEEWLQFVLVERLRKLAAGDGEAPAASQTATWATREFDGDPDASALLSVLVDLDALLNAPAQPTPPVVPAEIGALAEALIARCEQLQMVRTAYLAQVYAPLSGELTTVMVGFELTAPLPANAFADWPPELPMVAFALADDAVSRLVRLTRPVYVAP